jgi:sulfate adenylyltransferase large subunit
MATGASTADLAILLVDARHGLREQSHRHARIARLLGIQHFILAINKMDLVNFDRSVFSAIRADFEPLLIGANVNAIPVSALQGDNVIERSERTPWYEGESLLEYLETVQIEHHPEARPFRFPVQLVLRPHHEFRGYAGQIVSGTIRPGDAVTVWPSGLTTRVARIATWEGDLDVAHAPMSVTLTLEDEIDISRGDTIATSQPHVGNWFEAELVWMDERPLQTARPYLIKHTTRTVLAELNRSLELNQIGRVSVATLRPLIYDRYSDNRGTGSFIVIDPATNFTAGAGMILNPELEAGTAVPRLGAAERLAQLARAAPSEAAAIEAVRHALEEILV